MNVDEDCIIIDGGGEVGIGGGGDGEKAGVDLDAFEKLIEQYKVARKSFNSKLEKENDHLHIRLKSVKKSRHLLEVQIKGLKQSKKLLRNKICGLKNIVDEHFEQICGLKNIVDEHKQRAQCKVCMEKELGILFLPCKHFVCCESCGPQIFLQRKVCPLCRGVLEGLCRAFF